MLRGQLKGVAVAAGNERAAAAPLFGCGRGREEIVGLIARAFGVGKTAGSDEVRNDGELLDQIVIEFAAALVRGKRSWR